MLKPLITIVLTAVCAHCTHGSVDNMRCEYLLTPIGIDAVSPRLTWEVTDTEAAAAGVTVVDTTTGKTVWHSGKLAGNAGRVAVNARLRSMTSYRWTVTVTDITGKKQQASSTFETGPLKPGDWTASWISDRLDKEFEPAPVFKKEFMIDDDFDNARLYVSAAGYYVMNINGCRVGDHHMDPGYTHYDRRNLFASHDVTPLLRKGRNVVTAVLGNGFYNCQSKAVWDFERARWRSRPALLCEIVATDSKGRHEVLAATDSTWTTATGPWVYNNIYSGDRYDATAAMGDWTSATVVAAPSPLLKAQSMPAIRQVERLRPTLLKSWGDTIHVFDMGKVIAGVTAIDVAGERGTHFWISTGEMLKNNCRLQQSNIDIYYRPEKPGERFQTDEFILAGTGDIEHFQPEFTYHGFRFVEVRSDRPVKLTADNVTGLFMHTDMAQVGRFECSNPLLNKIYDATMLSYLGNLHSIPTDCPQREKNGWTADAHASIDLGLLNYDGITFYEKWMNDFIDNQRESGNIAGIIPSSGWGYGDWPGPVWDAALFIIPEALYHYYGDLSTVERLYPTMERYFGWIKSLETEDGTVKNGIGDWLSWRAQTPTDYTSTVYYYLDCMRMADFSTLLGKDPKPYGDKAVELRDKINARWFNPADTTYAGGSQAALGVALYAGVVPDGMKQAVADKLHRKVVANGHFLDFGLLGTKTVLRMLTRYGYVDDAYAMATKTEAPSWGFWIDKLGYTTLPETWTLSPTFRDASINHVFFGDISAWMASDLAGINFDPQRPGFEHVVIRPHFPAGLDSASATYHSVRGEVVSSWKRDGDKVTLTVTVPSGSTATVYADRPVELSGGTHTLQFTV